MKKKTTSKVVCIKAATKFYQLGKEYFVYKEDGHRFVKASDGYYDRLDKMSSKFEAVE